MEAAFSPRNDLVKNYRVHPTHWLISTQVILALPTDEPFEGGRLKVWDGRPTVLHEYAMAPGDCIFLDARVWHQGCAITSGARYALVLFLRLRK